MEKFGRLASPPDERDFMLKNFIPKGMESDVKEKCWEFPLKPLDQGEYGHCVGFSMAGFGISYPTPTKYTNDDGHNFYYLCKIKDGEPKAENGSTIRTAAKVLVDCGVIKGYAFAKTIEEVVWWLLNRGPVIVGTDWYEGMSMPDTNDICHLTGALEGGHAYLLTEVKIINGETYLGIQNSWDGRWGKKGKAYISAKDFKKLLTRLGGEACTAIEIEPNNVEIPQADPTAKFNLFAFIIAILSRIFGKKPD